MVPKTLWGKICSCDHENRIELACNLLLIKTPNGNVLVETGMGPHWTERERDRYQLQSLLDHHNLLAAHGMTNEEIDAVLISHLHFDHAGGACLEKGGQMQPAFPKARYYVQKGEWEFAYTSNARAKASYRKDDFEALAKYEVLELIDGDAEILPGVKVHVSGGHTKHHQIVTFCSEEEKGIYFADIMPTSGHIAPAWAMGYDHYPLETCDAKSKWLNLASEENWLVVFDHEINTPWGHIKMNESGRFEWQALNEKIT